MEFTHDYFFRVSITKCISGAGTDHEKYGEVTVGDYDDEKSAKRKVKDLMESKDYLRFYNNIQSKKINFVWILYGFEYQPHFDTPSFEEITRGETEKDLQSYLSRHNASPISKKYAGYKMVKADISGEYLRPVRVTEIR